MNGMFFQNMLQSKMGEMAQRFAQFKQQAPQNAEKQVRDMMLNGKMTQQQFNQLRDIAIKNGAKF